MRLADKLLAIHAGLDDSGLEHAFGGAISLAYWTLQPRGTVDIDVNVFIPADAPDPGLDALPEPVSHGERDAEEVRRRGQVRVWWEETPIDLFFDYQAMHAEARRGRRIVPFAGAEIPVLGPVELAVFKAVFDRTRDWADIEAMLTAETLDVDAVREHLAELFGAGDHRLDRLDEAVARASAPLPGT